MTNSSERKLITMNPLQRSNIAVLFFGVVFGFFFAVLMLFSPHGDDQFKASLNHRFLHVDRDLFELIDSTLPTVHENGSLTQKLYKEVRVLCWVMTHPKNHKEKAIHVLKTWGKRCNQLLFMSSENDTEINAIALPVGEGRNNLWAKTKEAFKYVYENHFNEADWFMKADDDTYVFLENLRYMLYPYSPYQPIYFGCRFKPFVKQGFMSGGAGYVLSKAALKRFIEEGIGKCRQDADGYEDVEMGLCMEKLNVTAGDTRDSQGRETFFPFKPEGHLMPDQINKGYFYNNVTDGLNCCSTNAISFHYVTPSQMYVLEYLAYYFKVVGETSTPQELPKKLTLDGESGDENETESP